MLKFKATKDMFDQAEEDYFKAERVLSAAPRNLTLRAARDSAAKRYAIVARAWDRVRNLPAES